MEDEVVFDSLDLVKKISSDTAVFGQNIVQPIIIMSAKALLSILLISILIFISPIITMIIIAIFFIIYAFFFKLTKNRVNKNIEGIKNLKNIKITLLKQSLTYIKEFIFLTLNNDNILNTYSNKSLDFSEKQSFNSIISKLPKYIMMFLELVEIIIIIMREIMRKNIIIMTIRID